MNREIFLLLVLASTNVLAATACGSNDASGSDDDGAADGNAASGGGQEEACPEIARNKSGDGTSACSGTVCEAGEFCAYHETYYQCEPGCLSAANCPPNYACALETGNVGKCADPADLCEEESASAPEDDTCVERCLGKGASCEGGGSLATTLCKGFCADDGDIDCLEATSCAEIGDAIEQGTKICS